MNPAFFSRFFSAFLLCVLLASAVHGAASPPPAPSPGDVDWLDGRFAHERGDLSPDPSVTFGRLDNGFRYAVIPNARPEGRVCLYLAVQAGSFMETEKQRGYAHFVEHMAFNGSRSFLPGTLVPFFQKHGMSLGDDANAYTDTSATVYTLDLATVDPQDIRQGLTVLRDFADGITFDEKEVARERSVILTEQDEGESEIYRDQRRFLSAVFPGSRFTNLPIGEADAISAATPASLREFHDTWYRPERMLLIAAGPVEPSALEPMIRDAFISMRAKGTVPELSLGFPSHKGIVPLYHKNSGNDTLISIIAIHPRRHAPDSRALRKANLTREFCAKMLTRRLRHYEEQDVPYWAGVAVYMDQTFSLFPSATLVASTAGDRWESAFELLVKELGKALADGFDQEELDEVRKNTLASLEREARERPNALSSRMAEDMADSFIRDRVFLSPEQKAALYRELAASLTLEEVNGFFREAWDSGNRILLVRGNAELNDGEKTLLQVYERAMAGPLPDRPTVSKTPFPYLPVPEAKGPLPALAERACHNGALRLLSGTLANGATVRLVPSTLEKGRSTALLLFGGGLDSLPEEQMPAALLAEAVLNRGGVGKLARLESERLFDPLYLAISEMAMPEAFAILGIAPTEHLDTLLLALWTQYTDPSPREEVLAETKQALALHHNDRYNTVSGVLGDEKNTFFLGPSARNRNLTEEEAAALRLDDIKAVIDRTRISPALHILVIGDFAPEAALARVAALFGSAPLAPPLPPAAPLLVQFPAGQNRIVGVADPDAKAVISLAFRRDLPPTASPRDELLRAMLASLVREKLYAELRQKLGTVYSPMAGYQTRDMKSGYAAYEIMLDTGSAQVESVRKALNEILADSVSNGVDEKALELEKGPLLTRWKTTRENNSYWLDLLMREYLTGLPHLERSDTVPELIKSITKEELDAEVRAAFIPEMRAELIVTHDPRAEKR